MVKEVAKECFGEYSVLFFPPVDWYSTSSSNALASTFISQYVRAFISGRQMVRLANWRLYFLCRFRICKSSDESGERWLISSITLQDGHLLYIYCMYININLERKAREICAMKHEALSQLQLDFANSP